jgi:hypothetical protein
VIELVVMGDFADQALVLGARLARGEIVDRDRSDDLGGSRHRFLLD